MKKLVSLLLAALMLLSLASLAAADDEVVLELLYHKSETDAMNAMLSDGTVDELIKKWLTAYTTDIPTLSA